MREPIAILLFSVLFVSSAFGQNPNDVGLKLTHNKSYEYYNDVMPDNYELFSVTFSFSGPHFLNSNYHSRDLPFFGVDANCSYFLHYPFELDCGFFYHIINDIDEVLPGEDNYSFRGLYGGLNLYVLPRLGKITEHFQPYIGAGYQTSGINSVDADGNRYAAGTGNPYIQGGFKFYFEEGYYASFRYRQTLPNSSIRQFRSITVGIGLTL